MLKKNNLFIGLWYGLIAPFLAWLVFVYILHNESMMMNKPAVPYLLAIALNLLLVRYFYKTRLHKIANGVMVITFVLMLWVFLFKIHSTA